MLFLGEGLKHDGRTDMAWSKNVINSKINYMANSRHLAQWKKERKTSHPLLHVGLVSCPVCGGTHGHALRPSARGLLLVRQTPCTGRRPRSPPALVHAKHVESCWTLQKLPKPSRSSPNPPEAPPTLLKLPQPSRSSPNPPEAPKSSSTSPYWWLLLPGGFYRWIKGIVPTSEWRLC